MMVMMMPTYPLQLFCEDDDVTYIRIIVLVFLSLYFNFFDHWIYFSDTGIRSILERATQLAT